MIACARVSHVVAVCVKRSALPLLILDPSRFDSAALVAIASKRNVAVADLFFIAMSNRALKHK